MKKALSLITITVFIIFILTGCAPMQKTLHESDTLRVKRDGSKLIVFDLVGDAVYTLSTKRVRKSDTPQKPRSLVNTDTILITAQPGLTEITDKTSGVVVSIGRVRWRDGA